MKVIFFSKREKCFVELKNAIKICDNVNGFEDKCIRICCVNLSQLWQECMWWAVNVLKSSHKISDLTQGDVFELNLAEINRNVG